MKALLAVVASFAIAASAAAQTSNRPETKQPGPGEASPESKQKVRDAGLTGKVKSALVADVGMKTLVGVNVDSDTKTGVVTLKGHVDSADTKKRVEAVAKKVEGVKSVKNNLSIRKPKS